MAELMVKCPECIDERMIKLAQAVGYLVCPNCDKVVYNKVTDESPNQSPKTPN